jgi:extracellular factor (EF) 3-hydroxypalmitic acid methyl ester biosynthesis protein
MATELGKGIALFEEQCVDVRSLDSVYERMMDGQVEEGMAELIPLLQAHRLKANETEWREFVRCCLRHPLRELLHQDPFTYRSFTKPRGYAGDAKLLDYIYGREEGWPIPSGTTDMGAKIFDFTTASTACEGVRARRGFIANFLDQLVEEIPRPHVLSVAAGHLREVLLAAALKRRKIGRFVAFDADAQSLDVIRHDYGRFGVEAVQGSVRQVLAGRANLGDFHLIYSMGLFDYVPLGAAKRLTSAMFRMLRPGGRLLVANFLPGILDVGYMESYMDWKLIHRTRKEMLEISLEIPEAAVRDIRLFTEENQNIIFLQVTKK